MPVHHTVNQTRILIYKCKRYS
ncbi:unnamed protein product, partial [Rotaria sp. Silwood2]